MNDELLRRCEYAAAEVAEVEDDGYGGPHRVVNWPEVVKAIVKAAHPNTSDEDLSLVLSMAAACAREGTDESVRKARALVHAHDDIRGRWRPPGLHPN